MWREVYVWTALVCYVSGLSADLTGLSVDYFTHKNLKYVVYLSCEKQKDNTQLTKRLISRDIRVSVKDISNTNSVDVESALIRRDAAVGVLLDGACNSTYGVLEMSSMATLFDAMHVWLVLYTANNNNTEEFINNNQDFIENNFQHLNLSVDADIIVAQSHGDHYKFQDIFNFGKIQGNDLEKAVLGTWRRDHGLNISREGFKYYRRWDFHNLTLRAVSVILEKPKVFKPEMLEDFQYTPGVSAMTKIVAQLLSVLKEQHNFRFNYTIVDRWVGSPQRNSTLAVTNSLYWREQDISATCLRIFPHWLEWVDPFLPPATRLETKVYYLIPDKGVGGYENRFVSPLSGGVWLLAGVACAACAAALGGAAAVEGRATPLLYAVCSVLAAVCQQAYEDGAERLNAAFSSQSRRVTLLVAGLTCMLLYNYYTSSVVSWLLSAAPPTIAGLAGLICSDLELTFEDIGYTRTWLDNPGFYYYSGYYNPIEDELREKKVTNARRTVPLMQSVADGIELIRSGAYAYHSEPYTASRALGRRLSERELCELGALHVMQPAHVYVMGQKDSPYKQFFVWSLLRLLERGHTVASRLRVGGAVPPCSGQVPRALALGQAAPAFALLAELYLLATLLLLAEILTHRFQRRRGAKAYLRKQKHLELREPIKYT